MISLKIRTKRQCQWLLHWLVVEVMINYLLRSSRKLGMETKWRFIEAIQTTLMIWLVPLKENRKMMWQSEWWNLLIQLSLIVLSLIGSAQADIQASNSLKERKKCFCCWKKSLKGVIWLCSAISVWRLW